MPDPKDTYYQPFKKSLLNFNKNLQMKSSSTDNFYTLSHNHPNLQTKNFNYPDIWIRDVAPVITTKMVKFKYSPSYLKKSDSSYLNRQFTRFLKGKYHYIKSDLIVDGGNIQWNGKETIIATNQIFKDNPDWSHTEVIQELEDKLNISKVIIISKEPGDVLGHSDGMVKFIAPNKLLISDFSYEPGLLQKLKKEIITKDPQIKFITVPSSYTAKGQYDKHIASAKGLYINMLETKDNIYFPQYGLKNDTKAMRIVKKNTNKKIIPIRIGKLATTGGSIHCLTWEVPSRFLIKK
ncbi:agmatine deiminase family protein [Companilactobacillus keshanensis]|uniref:Agmatine deiminase family protein n=1 Tax=Companilactobacillus keshanensis TaxID=2486003 RepID=A0ABW4BUH8_9LACO|nr:agmatine deiminase family protein [Companilactobacillus keshanensis]